MALSYCLNADIKTRRWTTNCCPPPIYIRKNDMHGLYSNSPLYSSHSVSSSLCSPYCISVMLWHIICCVSISIISTDGLLYSFFIFLFFGAPPSLPKGEEKGRGWIRFINSLSSLRQSALQFSPPFGEIKRDFTSPPPLGRLGGALSSRSLSRYPCNCCLLAVR